MKKTYTYIIILLLITVFNSCIHNNKIYKFEIKIKNKLLLNSLDNFMKKHPNKYYSIFMNESLNQTTFIIKTNGEYAVKKPQYYLIKDNNMVFIYYNSNVNDFFVLNNDIDIEIKKRGYNIKYEEDSTLNLYTPYSKQLVICTNDTNLYLERTQYIPLKPEKICNED